MCYTYSCFTNLFDLWKVSWQTLCFKIFYVPFNYSNSEVKKLTNDCILAANNHHYGDNKRALKKKQAKWIKILQSQSTDMSCWTHWNKPPRGDWQQRNRKPEFTCFWKAQLSLDESFLYIRLFWILRHLVMSEKCML